MRLTYGPAKSTRNEQEQGMPFALAADFDWSAALIVEDLHQDYNERRFQYLGFIDATHTQP
ncbi:MAG: hypothetical protein K2Y10_13200 [Burkholderiaceae bacterium]|nr:hypothetical protein [Burkholderiaceae bacterium]